MAHKKGETRKTPYGTLYKPQEWPTLLIAALLSLALGPFAGYQFALVFEATTHLGFFVCIAPFIFIFIFGYFIWAARLQALAYTGFGKGVAKYFVNRLLRNKVQTDFKELLPNEDQLTQLAVNAQKAASSFRVAAIPIAVVASLVVGWIAAAPGFLLIASIYFCTCLVYGIILSHLGRRGFLPFPDESNA